jgi:hypothetical protein
LLGLLCLLLSLGVGAMALLGSNTFARLFAGSVPNGGLPLE